MKNDDVLIKCRGGGSIINKTPIFSPNGLCLYIPCRNLLRSFNVVSGERITEYEGNEDVIVNAQVNLNNPKLLMACTTVGEIMCWKWKTELLVSKTKINIQVDEVLTFHVLALHDYQQTDDCEIILSWLINKEYHVGIFSSNDCKLQTEISVKIKTKRFSVAVGGSPGHNIMAVIERNKLQCSNLTSSMIVRSTKIHSSRQFTCVACHPVEQWIATGDNTGRILIWRDMFREGSPTQALYHWHALPVRTIAFSQSGGEFFSGASECVVVRWQLDNPQCKGFLPRMAASVEHLVVAPDNFHLAVTTADNGVQIVDSHFRLKSMIQQLVWGAPFPAGLVTDSRSRAIMLNGRQGHLQLYCPHNMSLLYNLDVVGQNKLTQERNLDIPNTHVIKIALSRGSDWLATVEELKDGDKVRELRMKFWQFDSKNQSYSLNTSVEFPHENGVNAIEFQYTPSSTQLLCVSAGKDKCFKIWNLEDTTTIYRKSRNWCCHNVGYFRDLPASSLSFSSDGSVLAVAFGSCLTLWSPDTCTLKSSLLHPAYRGPLRYVLFGNFHQCHLVVTASDQHLCVWNLLTLSLMWSVPVRLAMLCADPASDHMAAITEKNSLFVFQPNSMSVVYSKTDLCGSKENIMTAAFVPHGTEHTLGLSWQKNSQLYFINSNQELLCLETKEEQRSNVEFEFTSQTERSAFSAMLAQSITSEVKSTEQRGHMHKGLSGAMTLKQLINPPVHTMAPMRLLCGPVLRSLVQTDRETSDATPAGDEENGVAATEEEARELRDEENESPVRRRPVRPTQTSRGNSIQETAGAQDLCIVLEESSDWASVLV